MSGHVIDDVCITCRGSVEVHYWCSRKRQRDGVWFGGHVCTPCGHASGRCEKRDGR